MKFKTISELKSEGFSGFFTIDRLIKNECAKVPKVKGIYFVIRKSKQHPVFIKTSIGGHFKGKNPTVDITELENKWVDDAIVINIGKAGGDTSSATLQSRLKQYMKFGQGVPIGHWGGRYIWQLKDCKELLICWKAMTKEDPRSVEKELILDFQMQFGKRPFANLVG